LPSCAAHIWGWFQQLTGKRTAGMSINPITYSDIDAWSRLYGIRPKAWELDALSAIDAAFMNSVHEEQQQKVKKPKK
jgi:hypothetical protein